MSSDRALWIGGKPAGAAGRTEFANNRAYLIGIDAYCGGIPPLRTAEADAAKLGEILESSHGYQVRLFPRDGALSLDNLKQLLQTTMPGEVGEHDRVLVYFAGHGIALEGDDGPAGYLIPVDASLEDRDSFLSMTEVNDALAQLPCRHLMLILDCCFAGAFRWSSTRDLGSLPDVIHRERFDRYIQDPAWQVLTSAAHDQKALDVLSGNPFGERIETTDHSPFATALFRALDGEADVIPRATNGNPGGDGVITATELYLFLRECVETATEEQSKRQTPGLWPLKKHDKGEYILLTPGHELNLPPAPELNYDNNPYRGLQSFDEEHRELFFGRKHEIDQLHLLVSRNPLTVVLGASGTGKSSVVKAGLLPHLRDTENESWQILPVIRPGKSPLSTLANVTLPGQDSARSSDKTFAGRIQTLTEAHPANRWLLVVDQFEELVTLCENEEERDRFIDALATAVQQSPERFRLVITLRSDFEPQFLERAFGAQWMSSRYIVPPMSTDDLREAIEGPASVRVLYFQPSELVDQLIDEVIQTPGAMPLLSFTLSELFVKYLERRGDDRCLNLADYEQLGGVAGSLRSRATELYDQLDDPHRATMRRIMLRMVSAQGGELARRRVPRLELTYEGDEENERVASVLKRLSSARLIVEGKEVDGDPYVEPAHDALVRGWDKLLQWTREEQEQITLRQLLTPAANDWHRHQGGTWIANPRLSLVKRISRSEDNWLNQMESRFVTRSAGLRRRFIVAAYGSVAIAFLVLGLVTYYALKQRGEAIASLQTTTQTVKELLSLYLELPRRASRIAAATTAAEARTAYEELQREGLPVSLRVTSPEIAKALDKIDVRLERWKSYDGELDVSRSDHPAEECRQAVLDLVEKTAKAWETGASGNSLAAAAQNDSANDWRTLEWEILTSGLCARAKTVTRKIADHAPDKTAMLGYREEFEKLYWAELYWVELKEKSQSNGTSRLETAMWRFRKQGLKEWQLDQSSKLELQELAAAVGQQCDLLMSTRTLDK